MKFTRVSPFTGVTHTKEIQCTEAQYNKWLNGTVIQDVMPNLTPAEREFIITGITDEEWKQSFR
jgi:hypothetical protein